MLFFIIGKSGSGKDTILKGIIEEISRPIASKKEDKSKEKKNAKILKINVESVEDVTEETDEKEKEKKDTLKQLVGYTTRPMRDGEVDGVEYHFVDNKTYKMLKKQKKILEERMYKTNKGKWYYFTVNDEQLQNMDDLIAIGPLKQYEELNKKLGTPMIPLYIDINSKTRYKRMMERENKMANPDYKELDRRFQADEDDFREVNKIEGLVIIDNNGSLKSSVRTAVKYIKNILESFDMLRNEVFGIRKVEELSVTEFADKDDDLVDKEDDDKDTFEVRKNYGQWNIKKK